MSERERERERVKERERERDGRGEGRRTRRRREGQKERWVWCGGSSMKWRKHLSLRYLNRIHAYIYIYVDLHESESPCVVNGEQQTFAQLVDVGVLGQQDDVEARMGGG